MVFAKIMFQRFQTKTFSFVISNIILCCYFLWWTFSSPNNIWNKPLLWDLEARLRFTFFCFEEVLSETSKPPPEAAFCQMLLLCKHQTTKNERNNLIDRLYFISTLHWIEFRMKNFSSQYGAVFSCDSPSATPYWIVSCIQLAVSTLIPSYCRVTR